MSKINVFESSEKNRKKWRLRLATFTLIVVTGATTLVSCCKTRKNDNTSTTPSTTIETLTPTDEITPTEEVTPTVTSVPTEEVKPTNIPTEAVTPTTEPTKEPTPSPVPTETPIPTPKPEDRNVSYDDLTTRYNISGACFGEEESFDKEVEKRTNYYKSFKFLSDNEINKYIAGSNINNPNSTLEFTSGDIDDYVNAVLKICRYNNKNENANKQCLLVNGAIGESLTETDRLVIATIQRDMVNAMNNNKFSRKLTNFGETTSYYIKDESNPKTIAISDLSEMGTIISSTAIWGPLKEITRDVEATIALKVSRFVYDNNIDNVRNLIKQKTKTK